MSGQSPGAVFWNGTAPPVQPSPAAPYSNRGHETTGSTMFIAGIVLLGVIAVGLAIFFYFVRQRQANEVARLEREREERRRRAAERRAQRELEARQRAASIPIKTVVPVFIMQPDGRLLLAAHTALDECGKDDGGSDGSVDGSEPKPPEPQPETGSMRRSRSFPWRRQADRPAPEAELSSQPADGTADGPPPPPPLPPV